MTDIRIAIVTVPDHETALRLARHLVGNKLAACVNIIPSLTSIYQWRGELCEESEELLVIKTVSSGIPKLLESIEKEHPYDVPEGLVLDVKEGLEPYLAWVGESVGAIDNEGQGGKS